MTLQKIIDIQKVGRFEKLDTKALKTNFSKVVLVFGENGWGKSTLADILRSLSTSKPEIIKGRETLSAVGQQKIILLFDGQQSAFDGTQWSGQRPKISVFDQSFINENVFSGDNVSHDHLKKQYGLVVGERGVQLVGEMLGIDEELKNINGQIKTKEKALEAITRAIDLPAMNASDFVALIPLEETDTAISDKELQIKRASLIDQIKNAPLPDIIMLPTEASAFKTLLMQSVDGIATEAYSRLRQHIEKHRTSPTTAISHESWLESGLAFSSDDSCPFCGQHLDDKQLVVSYRDYFSAAYKQLSDEVKQKRATLGRYIAGDFKKSVLERLKSNTTAIANWQSLANVELPVLPDITPIIPVMEELAKQLDNAFADKQVDLVNAIQSDVLNYLLTKWDSSRSEIANYNEVLSRYIGIVKPLKDNQERPNIQQLNSELSLLKARQQRANAETVVDINERQALIDRKDVLTRSKNLKKEELTQHTNSVTTNLGTTINAYLKRLGAGFKIDYQQPNYRGSEPAAAYSILINETPVSPRASDDDAGKPNFKNTLSTGDKSVLALALFLATLHAEGDLSDKIVVMDDPFTSMDEFRRTFTANEIYKLSNAAKQVIILSHKKSFLRLLWDRIGRSNITSIAIQTGAPGLASLAPFCLEEATQPRQETERNKVLQFLDVTEGEPAEIRRLLRTVLEHFYRNGDVDLFDSNETLDGIIRKIEAQEDGYRYKGALEELKEINFYTRNFHHAPVNGSVTEETNVEELKTYCERVRDLTRGSA